MPHELINAQLPGRMGGEKKVVEGRYWSCGVGGLWGFKGGRPGRLERSQAGKCGMDRTAMMPHWVPGLPGWDVSSDSQACPVPLSGGPGSPSLAPWPNPAWPPLHLALLSDLFLSTLPTSAPSSISARVPLPLCCPLSPSAQLSEDP